MHAHKTLVPLSLLTEVKPDGMSLARGQNFKKVLVHLISLLGT